MKNVTLERPRGLVAIPLRRLTGPWMLRISLQIVLALIVCMVWYRPLEAAFAVAPESDLAQSYARSAAFHLRLLEYDAAVAAYEQAIDKDPLNPQYHLEIATIHYLKPAHFMRAKGWSKEQICELVLREARTARDLAPRDYRTAHTYARFLMGHQLTSALVNRQEALEAWRYCLDICADYGTEKDGPSRRFASLLGLARVELRWNEKEHARGYLIEALDAHPDSYIASNLLRETRPSSVAFDS